MTSQTFMGKARSALGAASLLLDNGFADDACNRAYYAMFDAARAALLADGAPVDAEQIQRINFRIRATYCEGQSALRGMRPSLFSPLGRCSITHSREHDRPRLPSLELSYEFAAASLSGSTASNATVLPSSSTNSTS